jgi:hypothetical protein
MVFIFSYCYSCLSLHFHLSFFVYKKNLLQPEIFGLNFGWNYVFPALIEVSSQNTYGAVGNSFSQVCYGTLLVLIIGEFCLRILRLRGPYRENKWIVNALVGLFFC